MSPDPIKTENQNQANQDCFMLFIHFTRDTIFLFMHMQILISQIHSRCQENQGRQKHDGTNEKPVAEFEQQIKSHHKNE